MIRHRRTLGAAASLLLVLGPIGGVGVGAVADVPAGAATSSTGTFTPLTPARLLDTRAGTGAPEAPVVAGGEVTLTVDGRGGVPASGVSAVVLNVTVAQPTANGYLTVYPDGVTRPLASNLNFVTGKSVPNLVIAPVGTDGDVDLYNGSSGTVQLVADVSGYFSNGGTPADGTFTPLTPDRLLDTRVGTGAPEAPVAAGSGVTLTVDGQGGVPASGVSAVVLNVTATQGTAAGYVTVSPDGVTRPLASNLNFVAGKSVPNLVIAPVGADGDVDLYNGSSGTVQLVADVSGYFTGAATSALRGLESSPGGTDGASTAAVTPRSDGPSGPVGAQSDIVVQAEGAGGVPASGVSAVVLNVTATQPTANGYLTVFPDGVTRPLASNLNFSAGQTVPNLVIAPVGADGDVDLYNGSLGTVQLIADVSGYFLTTGGLYAPLTPSRILDTRNGTGTGPPGTTGSVSGTVEDASAHGLAGVVVTAYAEGAAEGTATTATDGSYDLTGLAAGSTDVCFDASAATGGSSTTGYADQCWDGAAWDGIPGDITGATSVDVVGGAATTGIDARLAEAGGVSGTVTVSGASGIAGVVVEVIDAAGTPLGSATTGTNGSYTVGGLAAGSVDVCFDATPVDDPDQCYNGVTWDGVDGDVSGATAVTVAAGSTTTGIDATLAAGGTIAGTVTDATDHGIDDVTVDVLQAGVFEASGTTASDGTYTVPGLHAGPYDVCFDASSATGGSSTAGYLDQCWHGVSWDGDGFDTTGSTAVTVTAGSTTTGIDATLAIGGAISGTVTDGSDHPLGGVEVDVYGAGDTPVGTGTETGADGTYTVPGLPTGTYDVCFDASVATGGTSTTGYGDQCYDDVAWGGGGVSAPGATGVAVSAGSTRSGVDAALVSGGSITGTVTDAGSHPLAGVGVEVFDSDGTEVGSSYLTTGTDGTYTVDGLAAGSYDVCFDALGATGGTSTTGYLDQCYHGVPWDGAAGLPAGADAVAVTAGAVTTGIGAALGAGGAVSGTVTDTGDHPLNGVGVEVVQGGFEVGYATTGADGTYSATGLAAGTYDVCFDGSSATGGTSTTGYLDQCWDDVAWDGNVFDVTGPTSVAVTAGTTRSAVDASLGAGGAVAGTVTDGSSHPLDGVTVDVYDDDDVLAGTAETGSDGTYTVDGLAAGTYDVCFDASSTIGGSSTTGYTDQCWDDVTWDGFSTDLDGPTSVAVTAGTTRSAVNASLAAGGAISGTVTDAGSHPLVGVEVSVFVSGASDSEDVTTGTGGTYDIAGLVPGTYDVCFDGSAATGGSSTTGYLDQCYQGVAWDGISTDVAGATGVTATSGSTHSAVDASLAAGGAITGTVTDTGSHPLAGASVDLFQAGSELSVVQTGSGGTYSITGLSPGAYDVCFDGSVATGGTSTTGYLDQCYDGVAWDGDPFDITGATDVDVTAGATASGVDASLAAGGSISGTVTDAGSDPLGDVAVDVVDTGGNEVGPFVETASDGTYTVAGLPAGTYHVCFAPSTYTIGSSDSGYLDQCYDGVAWDGNSADVTGATSVVVASGATRSGIGAVLAAGGAVSGTVTDAGHHPLDDVNVYVIGPDGVVGESGTGTDGTYDVTGLTGGTYEVCFDSSQAAGGSSTTGYLDQCWNDVAWDGDTSDTTGATTVTVSAGSTSGGVDATLAGAGAVSGTVTDAAHGGVAQVSAEVIDAEGDEVGYATTDAQGDYTVDGLSPGSYDVCFDTAQATGGSSTSGYLDQCWNDAAWGGEVSDTTGATAVTVAVAANTSGVDATLVAAGAVSGTVTDSGDHPLAFVTVLVLDASGDVVGSSVETGEDGAYAITGLPAGTYDVCFDASTESGGSSTTGYLDQCWRDAGWDGDPPDVTGATAVTVTTGSTTSGVDAALASGAAIAGTVTDTSDHPLSDVDVEVLEGGVDVGYGFTGVDGTYSITGLPAGTYDVCFDASLASGGSSTTGYDDQCYDGVAWDGSLADVTGATGVTVAAGATRTGVDAALPAAA